MWSRFPERTKDYRGIHFRSGLEADVAAGLDQLGLEWYYEMPTGEGIRMVSHPVTRPKMINWYLPDFTIPRLNNPFGFPLWIEVKPSDCLYVFRDHLNIRERFDGTITVHKAAKEMRDFGFDELWKPKLCAEFYGESVLVVSVINKNKRLSIQMYPDHIDLSKSHPGVNFKQVIQDRERHMRQKEREEEFRLRQKQYEDQRRIREETRRRWVYSIARMAKRYGRPSKYENECVWCLQVKEPGVLLIVRENGRWVAICRNHVRSL